FLAHRRRLLGSFPKGYELVHLQEMHVDTLLALDGRDAATFARLDENHLHPLDLERRGVATAVRSDTSKAKAGHGASVPS
ncbi:hypothetical protein, partial [Listeria seeligeri]|uniref:hypothetical protein n=1 Tax=Listeria seeligeri TaxID=1640 RepID=UPI0022EB7B28